MTTEALPAAITVYPGEMDAASRLDHHYIDGVAKYVADCIDNGVSVEANFQPGDGTRYALVFTPLPALATAPARHALDQTRSPWERHSVDGCRANSTTHQFDIAANYYAPHSCLVTWVGHAAYPIVYGSNFSADYIAEKFRTTHGSGLSLTILFRAINHHLEGTL